MRSLSIYEHKVPSGESKKAGFSSKGISVVKKENEADEGKHVSRRKAPVAA